MISKIFACIIIICFLLITTFDVNAGYQITKINTAKIGFLTLSAFGVFSTLQASYLSDRSDNYYELYKKATTPDTALLFRNLSKDNADDMAHWRNISIVSFTGAGLLLLIDIVTSLKDSENENKKETSCIPEEIQSNYSFNFVSRKNHLELNCKIKL